MKQSEATITEDFAAIFSNIETKIMNKLRVGTLARVSEVNESLLTVQPIIMEKINTPTAEKYVKLPEIHNVYCVSGQHPKIGDYVICVHMDRGADNINLYEDTNELVQENNNRHNLNDCVAIVIKTENEWEVIGEYTSKKSDIDVSKYSIIKAILSYGEMQTAYQLFDISNVNKINMCKIKSDEGSATFKVIENKLEITELTNLLITAEDESVHVTLYLYGM